MFLIDTDVLSALQRRARHPGAVRWLEAQRPADLYLSRDRDSAGRRLWKA